MAAIYSSNKIVHFLTEGASQHTCTCTINHKMITLPAEAVAKYCDEHARMRLSLWVRSVVEIACVILEISSRTKDISGITRAILTNCLCMLPMAVWIGTHMCSIEWCYFQRTRVSPNNPKPSYFRHFLCRLPSLHSKWRQRLQFGRQVDHSKS